jgi:AcrR family transcriptional regulator
MEEASRAMTISELSSLSDLPLSTIKFYIRESLVPGPKKTRGTRAYYDAGHLHRLRLIKKIQAEGNQPLSKIKEIIGMIEDGERTRGKDRAEDSTAVKDGIVTSAIQVFREKGYEKATIADMVATARIGRSTFYKHFRDKKGLFIECVKQIIFKEMKKGEPDEVDEIRDEEDILRVFDRHAKAYYNVNPLWIDMVNQLRAAAINEPQEFAGELDEVIHLKISLLKRGLEKGIRRGLFREINPTLMAVMLLGLQDYHDYLSRDTDGKSLEERYDEATDIILYGILKRRTEA